jgi:hypothetical protein
MPIHRAAMFHVDHVRWSGVVGARSGLERVEAIFTTEVAEFAEESFGSEVLVRCNFFTCPSLCDLCVLCGEALHP